MIKKKLMTALALAALLVPFASAHPGKTDANGGHYDHSTGEYHYHHGYPAHQHPNGICPYDYDDQTGVNSGTSSSESDSESEEEVIAEPEEEVPVASTEETPLYNGGYGDDGTFETAYNLGYQHGMEALFESNKELLPDISPITERLCHERAKSGSTSYADALSSFNDAYEQGYYQSETDFYTEINNAVIQYEDPDNATNASYYNKGREDGKREGNLAAKTEMNDQIEQMKQSFKTQRIIICAASAALSGIVLLIRRRKRK